jgi:hypothetical protein
VYGIIYSYLPGSYKNHPYHESNKKYWEELIAYFPWYATGHIENDALNNFSILACVFVTAVTFLPSRCIGRFLRSRYLTTIRGFLPSRCLATIRGYTRARAHTHTHTQQCDLISLLLFFLNKENRLKWICPVLNWGSQHEYVWGVEA